MTLDGAESIGTLLFGDQGNTYGWTLNTGGGGPLTLAASSGSPTIAVNNQTTSVSAVLAGSAGMTKTGAGILSLAAQDTLSGVTVVSNGAVQLSGGGGGGGGTLPNTAITVYGPGELQINTGDCSGYGNANALTLNGGTLSQVSANTETLGRPITLNNGTITASPGAGIFGNGAHQNGDCYNQDGIDSPVGAPIITAPNSTNYIAMPAGTQFSLRGGSFSNAPNSVLIVNGVLDTFAINVGQSHGLVKTGAGTMILNSNCTFNVGSTINGGRLEVDGSTGASAPATVNANGILAGTGTVSGGVTVASGGTVMAGTAASLGTLSIGNGLTFNAGSTNAMRINKTGVTLTSDRLQGMASVSYGGTLTVTATGAALAAGDSFTLFSSSSYGGAFASYNLPALAAGLNWNTAQLPVNGAIQVATSVNTTPTNITATVSGNVLSLSWPADHTGWRLLVQTNHLASGVSGNTNDWTTVPGSAGINQTNLTINPATPTEYYRLAYP